MEFDETDNRDAPSWSSTVDVFCRINYTKIMDIDTINQRFQAEALIESKWYDPNIQSFTDKFDEKTMWKPELYVDNGVKDVSEEITYKILPNTEGDGYFVCELRKVRGIFWENLELQNFPLDVQDLSILVTTKKAGKVVNFKTTQEEEKRIKINNTLDQSMWKLHKMVRTRVTKIRREYSSGVHIYPAIKLTAQAFRLPGFFYWNAVLPILLVTLASLCPFVIDVKLPQNRLPSTATMLLTTVNMRWIVGRLLPTVSYLTSLDKYSLGSIIIIVIQFLYHAAMASLYPHIPQALAYRLDGAAFIFFLSLIALKQITFVFWIQKVIRFRKDVTENRIQYESHSSDLNVDIDDENIQLKKLKQAIDFR